jgi:DNA-binding CsgD family transcriptional regulator
MPSDPGDPAAVERGGASVVRLFADRGQVSDSDQSSGRPVGRVAALACLRSALTRTTSTGRPVAVFAAGAAGAGKTRLMREFAQDARRDAANVWIADPAQPDSGPPWRLDRLDGRPAVLVVDDLHAADAVTCALLAVILHGIRRARLLVAAAYRPDGLGPGHPLRRMLAELPRTVLERLYLGGPALVEPAGPEPEPEFGLTVRERQVLLEIAAGCTNRQIARKLVISEHTVSIHVSRILAKLDVGNRTAAAATVHRLGLR